MTRAGVAASPPRMAPVAVLAHTVTTPAGVGCAALQDAVAMQRSGLRPMLEPPGAATVAASAGSAALGEPLAAWVGRVDALDAVDLPAPMSDWDCRATRLAWLGLHGDGFAAAVAAARERHGPTRVGLVLGTSASTIGASEEAYRRPATDGGFPARLRHPHLHSPHAVAAFCARALSLTGPTVTISTACSSSARACGHAERWLRLGLVDAVVVGGVDAVCDSVLYGFHALGLIAPDACRPFDAARRGVSIGEAAGFALLERAQAGLPHRPQALLLGYGESNDAHHMSSPHPQGLGAEQALDDALARAGVPARAVQYLNLHGTATPQNDAVEAALVARRYDPQLHASATKGLTGHAMGAAGIVEAAMCLLALQTGLRSGSAGLDTVDPALGKCFEAQLRARPVRAPTTLAATHSFGFGGNNSVLVFGTAQA